MTITLSDLKTRLDNYCCKIGQYPLFILIDKKSFEAISLEAWNRLPCTSDGFSVNFSGFAESLLGVEFKLAPTHLGTCVEFIHSGSWLDQLSKEDSLMRKNNA